MEFHKKSWSLVLMVCGWVWVHHIDLKMCGQGKHPQCIKRARGQCDKSFSALDPKSDIQVPGGLLRFVLAITDKIPFL